MSGMKIVITEGKDGQPIDVKMFGSLNETDWGIIFYLSQKERTMGELTRLLNIAPVNTWKHINKLKQAKIVTAPDVKKGKKKIIKLKGDQSVLVKTSYALNQIRYKIKHNKKP